MKDCRDVVFWKDVPVPIVNKESHIRKIGGKVYNSFIKTFGDIPVLRHNPITNKFEEVENKRGKAYAARKRLKYRRGRNSFDWDS